MADIFVANAAELYAALSSAQGGDRIVLAGGDYGSLDFRGVTFSSDVTIVSADPDDPAIVRELYVRDSSHLVFDGILFDYVAGPDDPLWERPFHVIDSSYITFRNSVFDGAEVPSDIASGEYGNGIGLQIQGSDHIVIENNEFFYWYKALGVGQSTDIVVSYNDVHTIRSDGFNFVSVDGLLVEGNWLHDFKMLPGSGDHLDMIQFWTVLGETSSRNVIIRGNFLDAGDGDLTQSIFMRNGIVDTGQGSFEDYAYVNILIEDNVIYNHHVHGITVGETDGLTISNNTLLNDPYVRVTENIAPRINLAESSLNVTVENNILESMWNWETITSQPGWTVGNNLFVQHDDPGSENYYADLFVNALGPNPGLADLRALPGGLIEQLGVGAAAIRFDATPEVGPAR